MGFSAFKYLEEYEKAGIPQEQAKVQLRALENIIDSNLATKEDVALIQRDIVGSVQNFLSGAVLPTFIAAVHWQYPQSDSGRKGVINPHAFYRSPDRASSPSLILKQ